MDIVPDFQETFTKLFFKGFKIVNFKIELSAKEMHFYLEPESELPICPGCNGSSVVVHEYRKRVVQDGSIFGYKAVLFITYRTFKCKCCNKYGTEKIEFLSERSRFTKRLEDTVNEDLEMAGSIKDTAYRTGLSWASCKRIHKRYLQKKIYFNLGNATHLAIDEFSLKKGHKYATIVVDLDTKRVIWVGRGKTVRDVNRFFKLCGTEGCKQIKAVAMDQNAGFANCVKRYCPNACVVYDLFHMVYNFGRLVISAIRLRLAYEKKDDNDEKGYSLLKRSRFLLLTKNSNHMVYNFGRLVISAIRLRLAYEKKDDNDEKGYSLLKRSRFLLLTKNSNLSEEKRIKLNDILSFYHDLYAANELKELLPEVFNSDSKEEAEALWDEFRF